MNCIHTGDSGNALTVKGRRETEDGDMKGKLDQGENWEQRDRREPVVRSEVQKHQKEDRTDGAREEGASIWLEAKRSAFRVSSKTMTARSAGAV